MKLFHKKPGTITIDRRQALACRPIKNSEVTCSRLNSGVVMLTYPIRLRPWLVSLRRWLGPAAQQEVTQKLELDSLGTLVWDLIDGKRSVQEIAGNLAAHAHLQLREAEVSVTCFLRELGKRGLIGLG